MKKTFLMVTMAIGISVGFNADSIQIGQKYCFAHANNYAVVPVYMQCPRPPHTEDGKIVHPSSNHDHIFSPACFWNYIEDDGQ